MTPADGGGKDGGERQKLSENERETRDTWFGLVESAGVVFHHWSAVSKPGSFLLNQQVTKPANVFIQPGA